MALYQSPNHKDDNTKNNERVPAKTFIRTRTRGVDGSLYALRVHDHDTMASHPGVKGRRNTWSSKRPAGRSPKSKSECSFRSSHPSHDYLSLSPPNKNKVIPYYPIAARQTPESGLILPKPEARSPQARRLQKISLSAIYKYVLYHHNSPQLVVV